MDPFSLDYMSICSYLYKFPRFEIVIKAFYLLFLVLLL